MSLTSAEKLLGLTRPYGPDDVARSFRRLSREAHPDRGGSQDAFVRLSEARDLALAAARRGETRVDPPPSPPPGEKRRVDRSRRHRPAAARGWNTWDARSAAWAREGYSEWANSTPSGQPVTPEPEPEVGGQVDLGDSVELLAVQFGASQLDVSGWSASFVARKEGVVLFLVPPRPVEVRDVSSEDGICVLQLCDGDEPVGLRGPIVERCHDPRGRIVGIALDVLPPTD